jgi:hypothetical protein
MYLIFDFNIAATLYIIETCFFRHIIVKTPMKAIMIIIIIIIINQMCKAGLLK